MLESKNKFKILQGLPILDRLSMSNTCDFDYFDIINHAGGGRRPNWIDYLNPSLKPPHSE